MFELIISDSTAARLLAASRLSSATAGPSRRLMFRMSLTVMRSHFDPFNGERDGDLLKDVPAPHCASTTGVYQPSQIKLEETWPDGEIDGKINVGLRDSHVLINNMFI